jgi:hypothetical protein
VNVASVTAATETATMAMLNGHAAIPCTVSGVTAPPIVTPITMEETRASRRGTYTVRPASAAAAAKIMEPASHPPGNFDALKRKPPAAPIKRDSAVRIIFREAGA